MPATQPGPLVRSTRSRNRVRIPTPTSSSRRPRLSIARSDATAGPSALARRRAHGRPTRAWRSRYPPSSLPVVGGVDGGPVVVVVVEEVVVDVVVDELVVVVSASVVVVVDSVDEVASVVVVCSSSGFSSRPGNDVGVTKDPHSPTWSAAARMNLAQIWAGREPPVMPPLMPWLRATGDPGPIAGTTSPSPACW